MLEYQFSKFSREQKVTKIKNPSFGWWDIYNEGRGGNFNCTKNCNDNINFYNHRDPEARKMYETLSKIAKEANIIVPEQIQKFEKGKLELKMRITDELGEAIKKSGQKIPKETFLKYACL